MGLFNRFFKNKNEEDKQSDGYIPIIETEPKRHYSSHVFISYSTKDHVVANAICHFLEQNGVKCWIAPRNISAGKNFMDEVIDAVNSSWLVVLITSYDSFNSEYVNNEISVAYENGKPILPFKIDSAMPQDEMEFFIKSMHWLEAYPNPEEYFDELLDSVNRIYDVHIRGSEIVEEDFDVYIGYSTMDMVTAKATCYVLEQNGFKCWIAPRNLFAGENYSRQIFEAVNNANFYVLIASANAYASQFVSNELNIAYNGNKQIISLRIDEQIPNDNLLYYLKTAYWLDLHPDSGKSFETFLQDINILNSNGIPNNFYQMGGVDLNDDSIALKRPFDAYVGDEPYIFVSYSHKDSDIIFEEISKFHDEGYPIWYDQGLTAGQEWDEEIEDALLDCSLLVVFISTNSMASNNVVDEIKLALEENIDIVPIYLEEAKLAKGLKLRLSQKHAIFKYKSYENDYLEDCFKAFDSANIPKI